MNTTKHLITKYDEFISENIDTENEEESLGKLEKIEDIPEDIKINDYIKSTLFQRKDGWYFENDDEKLQKLNIEFEGDDIIKLDGNKYKLSKEYAKGGEYSFDTRYPDEVLRLAPGVKHSDVPFGYFKMLVGTGGRSYMDGNDCFFKAEKISE